MSRKVESVLRYILSIFSADVKSLSSKRVIGVAAWAVLLWNYRYCCVHGLNMPACTEQIAWAASAMLGLGSVCKIFEGKEKS